MKILIVEDEVIPANYLKKILEKEGNEVVGMATKGVKAIEMAKHKIPEVIFMDIMLKDHISGAEAAREIHRVYPEIMIIFLTAYSDKEMIDFAVESNAFAYLLKPYRDKEILATLELAKAKLNTKDINQSDKRMSSRVELVSGYIFDTQLNRLFLHNEEVPLGNKALKLMQLLCQNRHITMEIESITNMLWEEPKSGQTLRSLIHRIREATCYDLIQNINKFGYKIGLKRA